MGNITCSSRISNETYENVLAPTMTGRLPYTLMNDFLSKYSFQTDLYALQGLLAALLHVRPEEITDIEILNPIEPGSVITDKNCILDIKLELNHQTIVNIELQTRKQDFWPDRSVTYLCRIFDHLREGESYKDVKPCIQIGILDNDMFPKEDPRYTDEFFIEYELQSKTFHTGYTGKFQIKMLLLNHLEGAAESEKSSPNGLYFWARLFRAKSWEELKMIADDNPRMKSFVGTVRQLTAEEKVSLACEARRRYSNEIATYEGEIKDLQAERDAITAERDAITAERDAITAERNAITAERDAIILKNKDLADKIAELQKRLDELNG